MSIEDIRLNDREIIEAVVNSGGNAAGSSARRLELRDRFDTNLLAVARRGTAVVLDKLKNVRFRAGDILLLDMPSATMSDTLTRLGLLPLARRDLPIQGVRRLLFTVGIFAAAILASAVAGIPSAIAFTAAAVLLVCAGVVRLRDAYSAIDWPIIMVDLLVQLSNLAVWATGIVMAAVVVFPGLTPARALTVLGLGSIAVGFAFKDIFENFFAGVLILWRYPFDRGDVLRVDNVTGRVQNITIRNTFIERMDGELVVVPNATMFKSNVEVLTYLPFRRYHTEIRTGLKVPIAHAAEVMATALKSCETVIHDRPIEVYAAEVGDFGIHWEISWWAGAIPREMRRSRHSVIACLLTALDQAGIEVPIPIHKVTMLEITDDKLLPPGDI